MCRVAQQAVCSLISGASESSRQPGADGWGGGRSCEVAEMEEVQLGTDGFYHVWEDTGNRFASALISLGLALVGRSFSCWELISDVSARREGTRSLPQEKQTNSKTTRSLTFVQRRKEIQWAVNTPKTKTKGTSNWRKRSIQETCFRTHDHSLLKMHTGFVDYTYLGHFSSAPAGN